MFLSRVELHANIGCQFDEPPINPRADETFTREPFDYVAKFSPLAVHHGREQHHAGFRRQRQNPVNNVAGGLVSDRLAAVRTMRLPDVREQQAQVVINLRGGRDGRTGIRAGTALLNRDGRRQTLDEVHLRLLHLVEELARVSGKGLDVFALAFRKDGVEGERRFPGPTQSGDHDQLVARDVERKVLEIMLTRAADSDEFLRHRA